MQKYMMNKAPAAEGRPNRTYRIEHTELRNKSLFNPPVSNNEHVKVFNKMVTEDIETQNKKNTKSTNN